MITLDGEQESAHTWAGSELVMSINGMNAALCVAVICRMVGRSYMQLEAVNRGTSPRKF